MIRIWQECVREGEKKSLQAHANAIDYVARVQYIASVLKSFWFFSCLLKWKKKEFDGYGVLCVAIGEDDRWDQYQYHLAGLIMN